MPAKIFMNLNNNNYTHKQLAEYKASIVAATPKPKAVKGLNSSIIDRIHNVRPGCGSCGK
jgi:hypothetical protein